MLMDGLEPMRAQYAQLFRNSPELSVEIPRRMTAGEFVIDEEQLHGFNLPGFPAQMQVVVLYRTAKKRLLFRRWA